MQPARAIDQQLSGRGAAIDSAGVDVGNRLHHKRPENVR